MQHLYREGLHAAMHAMLNVIPLHIMCGPGDMGAECDNPYSARFRPDRLLLFDKCPGGIGLSYKVSFDQMTRKLLTKLGGGGRRHRSVLTIMIQHKA